MTILEMVAALVGAALGWASGTLKAQLHSLRRPPSSLGSGGECHPGLAAPTAAPRPREAPRNEPRPHAARLALFAYAFVA